jgi:hypothetical protein
MLGDGISWELGWDGWKNTKYRLEPQGWTGSNVIVFCGAGRVAEDQTG